MTPTRKYQGDGFEVTFEPRRCIHAEECVHGLPAVFDRDRRPWVDPSRGSRDAIAAVVHRCPTGALKMLRADRTLDETPADAVRIRVAADGPLYVHGDVEILDGAGNTVLRDVRMALCRCGLSANKPLCDDSHYEQFADPGTIAEHPRGDTDEPGSGTARITPRPNASLRIDGVVELVSHDGARQVRKASTALCRCGASLKKPFCDGSHKRVGFTAD